MSIRTALTLSVCLLVLAAPFAPAQASPSPSAPAQAPVADPAPAAATPAKRFSAEDIEAATFTGDLPSGKSAITAKVQLLLDRSGISPGVVDGFKGGMSESALKAFQRRAGLPVDGRLTAEVWDILQAYAHKSMTQDYTITEEDAADLVPEIPRDYALQAQMTHLGYTSVAEKLGERFHMDEKFLAYLNPGVALEPGNTIKVMQPAPRIRGAVTRILIDKATRRVAAYDAGGNLIADYPATIGSDAMPSPSGSHTVRAVAVNPTYHYNPRINRQQGDNDRPLTLPPGPNNPVGSVWIDLSKPTYGIHGTMTPSRLFVNQSSGCVRLTNWDASELAKMVQPGVTTVEFLDPGVTIADALAGMTPAAPVVPAPLPRPASVLAAAASVAGTVTSGVADAAATTASSTAGMTPAAAPDVVPVQTGASVPAGQSVGASVLDDHGNATPVAPAQTAPVPPVVPPADPLADALQQALPDGQAGQVVHPPASAAGL